MSFFQKCDANWVDVLPRKTKKTKNRMHSSTKLRPIQGCLKKNEGYIYKNLINKQKKVQSNFQVNDLVRTADL